MIVKTLEYKPITLDDGEKNSMDFIEFLVKSINEEATDAGKYMQWAGACSDKTCKDTLNEIGNQELLHQKKLIDLLATLAKKGVDKE